MRGTKIEFCMRTPGNTEEEEPSSSGKKEKEILPSRGNIKLSYKGWVEVARGRTKGQEEKILIT